MVFFNYALRKLNAKIVYYGPGLCGKTTNLQWIHDHFEGGQRGKMLSLATEGDRTIFFDLLPLEIGSIRGMQVTLQLYTVPGQVHYNSTRQLVLRGADGVVFVADSQRTMARSNIESFKNLEENLLLQGVDLKGFPCVLQFNKRDLRDIMSIEEMDQMLNRYSTPIFEAIAISGVGVQETLEGIVKLVMRSLRERYEPMVTAGTRPPEMPVAPGPRPVAVPQSLRVPSAPSAAAAPPRVVPPTQVVPPAAAPHGYDPRAVTVDLQAATQPPTLDLLATIQPPSGETAAAEVAPPLVGEGAADFLVESRSPDDVPTAVFRAPELLEEPVPGTGPEVAPEYAGLADEVTETGMVADEAAVFFAEEEEGPDMIVEPPPPEPEVVEPEQFGPALGEAPPAIELPPPEAASEPEPSDLIFGEAVVTPVEKAELGEVVLERRAEEEAQYEDHVRAPGPFAEVPLHRDYPFGEPAVPEEGRPRVSAEPPPSAAAAEEPFAAAAAPAQFEEEPVAEAATAEQVPPSSRAPAPRRVEAAVDDLVASVIGARPRPGPPPVREVGSARAPEAPVVVVPPLVAWESVLLGEGDPFVMDKEASPVAAAAVVPTPVEAIPRTTAAIQVRAQENQLRLQLQGTGAIAEYGEVREMDILVPVPGPWIGNRRVTLQLRLTLTPAAEDGDVGSGDPS